MDITISVLGLIATVVAALAAVGSWQAARKSNAVARSVAGIETQRHQIELTPRFRIRCDSNKTTAEDVTLWITLVGPIGIGRLDEVSAILIDDRTIGYFPGPGPDAPPTLTRNEIDSHVWGPYKFEEGTDDADANGRTATQTDFILGIERDFHLVANPAPPWWHDAKGAETEWVSNHMGYIYLNLQCNLRGYLPWTISMAIDTWNLGGNNLPIIS